MLLELFESIVGVEDIEVYVENMEEIFAEHDLGLPMEKYGGGDEDIIEDLLPTYVQELVAQYEGVKELVQLD